VVIGGCHCSHGKGELNGTPVKAAGAGPVVIGGCHCSHGRGAGG
jgi:hypothetical protein